MSDQRRITITDIRKAGHCPAGIRKWCDGHDIDFRDLIQNGISVETLQSLNDGLADQVIERTYGKDVSG